MNLKEQIDQDIKAAMLAGEKTTATTLRGLKSAILYAEVAKGNREVGLSEPEIIDVLSKEAKKRQESADLYQKGNDAERAEAELTEKQLIERYLPKQLSDEELIQIVDEVIQSIGASGPQAMGQVIGAVKAKTQATADGSRIAALAKERLSQ